MSAALLLSAEMYQREIVSAMIPVLKTLLDVLSDDFTILGIDIGHSGAGEVLQIRFNLARVLVVNGRAAYPMGWTAETAGWMQVSVTVGSLIQHILLLAILVFAWPARSVREHGRRLLIALPLSATLLLVDIPLSILAEFWFPIRNELDQGAFWPLLAWSRFLSSGGGLMLALGFAIFCICVAQRDDAPRHRHL